VLADGRSVVPGIARRATTGWVRGNLPLTSP
jgi:hypothetical protein